MHLLFEKITSPQCIMFIISVIVIIYFLESESLHFFNLRPKYSRVQCIFLRKTSILNDIAQNMIFSWYQEVLKLSYYKIRLYSDSFSSGAFLDKYYHKKNNNKLINLDCISFFATNVTEIRQTIIHLLYIVFGLFKTISFT